MPEGDTVHRTANRLNDELAGFRLERCDLRVPKFATSDLRGEVVEEVIAVGKHLLHRIGEYTLHSHLKMEGHWDVYSPGQRWRAPAFKARAILTTSRAETVGFEIAEVRLVPRDREDELVGYLGPDPLGPQWNDAAAATAAQSLAADTRPIHVALLDQRNVAGFGNVYANEICFLKGWNPRTPACDLDVASGLELGVRLLQANRNRTGRTTTGINRKGQRLWVSHRGGEPCRRCGTRIQRISLGADPTRERDVYFCPHCQP